MPEHECRTRLFGMSTPNPHALVPLDVAARELDMGIDQLRALALSDDLDAHCAIFLYRESIDRLKARAKRQAGATQ